MDLIALHDRALESTGKIVAAVRPDQLTAPTPCPDWDVRALINHIIGGNHLLALVATGAPQPDLSGEPPDFTGGDIAAAYTESAKLVSEAWKQPGLLEQTVNLMGNATPGAGALSIHTMDKIVHGWDLAKACGQDTTIDPDTLHALHGIVGQMPLEAFRKGGIFGPAVAPGPGASLQEEVLGLLGRRA